MPRTKNATQYRQGDVFIERIPAIPGITRKQTATRQLALAHGEVTGHYHVLESADPVDWWTPGTISTANELPATPPGELFVALTHNARVSHPEHAPLDLPAGQYRITRQREYSPQAPRSVED